MRIAVLDDYPGVFPETAAFARLGGHDVTVFRDTERDPDRLAARLRDAEAVLLTQQRSRFPRAVIEKLPKLRFIAQTGAHTSHIDVEACAERGIVIVTAGKGTPSATAELTWALILASVRHIPFEVRALKEGAWQSTVGTGLRGKTLGIYGLGRIGTAVADVGRAFGMKVTALGRQNAGDRESFFASADVLSLHLPLNDATRGIVTAADLAWMKPTSLLVNTSRAPLIEPGALVAALEKGRPGFAAVDVYEDEPVLGGEHPLLRLPNALCTPHLGYAEMGTYEAYYDAAVDALLRAVSAE
ncbi:D-2-hydroxyacid dehydrogenase family protein [Pendulispora brunnea]|uniref:D-2-hydroxyacid dehydrogenase family protein n=1 Tax=Pendulispora brunnea TaxID=2905690 RepID=A0ABZ2JX16_9BACT